MYDQTGQGYLRESDLENYIQELIPTLTQLDGLEKSFHNFYVCTAVRKFLFFLDPLRTGKVRIQDILACSFLDDLLELRDEELPKVKKGFTLKIIQLKCYKVILNQYNILGCTRWKLVFSTFCFKSLWTIFKLGQRSQWNVK